jgi:hypothetical protein
MNTAPPFVLSLSRDVSAWIMAVLLALFVLRVLGQVLAATTAPPWLPPMRRWYSGLMPYRYLLPTQIVFVVVMTMMTVAVASDSRSLGGLSRTAGAWAVWASYVYALGMVVRAVRYARSPGPPWCADPDRLPLRAGGVSVRVGECGDAGVGRSSGKEEGGRRKEGTGKRDRSRVIPRSVATRDLF